jgi:hypothetical protein
MTHFSYIENEILYYGLSRIRMIVLYFTIKLHAYPYGIHPIVLHCVDGRLHVRFYHYYTTKNQLAQLDDTQQKIDYYSLYTFLANRNSVVLRYLVAP